MKPTRKVIPPSLPSLQRLTHLRPAVFNDLPFTKSFNVVCELLGAEASVLFGLVDGLTRSGKGFYMSNARIAAKLCCSEKHVRNLIDKLVTAGALVKQTECQPGSKLRVRYLSVRTDFLEKAALLVSEAASDDDDQVWG